MTSVTLVLIVVFGWIAATTSRGMALAALLGSLLLWPEYLRFQFGPILMSMPRVLSIIVLLRFAAAKESAYRWHYTDGLVLGGYVWAVFANLLAGAHDDRLSFVIGKGFDTVLPYFAVRCLIRNAGDIINSAKYIGVIILFLGVAAVWEAVTYSSPYQSLLKYKSFVGFGIDKPPEYRLGLLRAQVSTAHPIYFGMAMMLLCVLHLAIISANAARQIRVPRFTGKYANLVGAAGVFASLSSGPIVSLVFFHFLRFYEARTRYIKPTIYSLIFILIIVEAFSNRHFYELISYVSLSPGTAWYRSKLLEVAIDRLPEYWLVGNGGASVRHWGLLIDGREHADIVNAYVLEGLYSGLLGIGILMSIQLSTVRTAVLCSRLRRDERYAFVFVAAAGVIAFMFGSTTVGVFGPAVMASFVLYALTTSIGQSKPNAA